MADPRSQLTEILHRAYRIDALCDRFERDWQGSHPPDLTEFLHSVQEGERKEILRELLPIEIHHRLQRNDHLAIEDYRARYPDMEDAWFEEAVSQAKSSRHQENLHRTVENRRGLSFDLAGLRSELKEMGIDWDWPDLPPDTSVSEDIPKIIFEQARE